MKPTPLEKQFKIFYKQLIAWKNKFKVVQNFRPEKIRGSLHPILRWITDKKNYEGRCPRKQNETVRTVRDGPVLLPISETAPEAEVRTPSPTPVSVSSPSLSLSCHATARPHRRQVFVGFFAGAKHPLGMCTLSLRFLLCETERQNPNLKLSWCLCSDLIRLHLSKKRRVCYFVHQISFRKVLSTSMAQTLLSFEI